MKTLFHGTVLSEKYIADVLNRQVSSQIFFAENLEEATGMAVISTKKNYPSQEGWKQTFVEMYEVPSDIIETIKKET